MNAKNIKSVVLADSAGVDADMQKLDHPLKDVLEALRKIILSADSEVGEHIKGNAPSFLYIGEMQPFDPKEYKRYIIVSNVYQKIVSGWYSLQMRKLMIPPGCFPAIMQMAGDWHFFTIWTM